MMLPNAATTARCSVSVAYWGDSTQRNEKGREVELMKQGQNERKIGQGRWVARGCGREREERGKQRRVEKWIGADDGVGRLRAESFSFSLSFTVTSTSR